MAVLAIALVASGGGEEERPAVPATAASPVPRVAGSFSDPRVGVALSRPEGWTAARRRGAVRLRSRDRSVLVAVASAGQADAGGVLNAALRELRGEYEGVRVGDTGTTRIAGRPARSAVVSATSARGTALRVVVAAVEGRRQVYLVEVFAAQNASEARLAEAQTVINSLRLGK